MSVTVIKTANGYDSSAYKQILIGEQADLTQIDTTQTAPGSVAYTCKTGGTAMDKMWMWNGAMWVLM